MWNNIEYRKQDTQKHLKKMPIALLKHFDGYGGIGSFNKNQYKVISFNDKKEDIQVFNTIDELLNAGWTLD